jgi:hypothetical protein
MLGAAVLVPAAPAAADAPQVLRIGAFSLAFGPVAVGTTSDPASVVVSNPGPGALTGLQTAQPSDPAFSRSASTCGSTLAPGTGCTLSFTYTPSGTVAQNAHAHVSAAGNTAADITLMGSPDTPPFPLAVTGTSIDFGTVAVGATSASRSARIFNPGTGPVSFGLAVAADKGPFTGAGTTCGGSNTLAAGASCTLSYRFKPTASRAASVDGEITIGVTGGPTRKFPLHLSGYGGSIGNPPLQVTPRRLDFGTVSVGTTSASQVVTLTNVSGRSLESRRLRVSPNLGSDYHSTTSCPLALAAGASCTATITFAPVAYGLRPGVQSIGYQPIGASTQGFDVELAGHGQGHAGRLVVDRADVALPQATTSAPGPAPGVATVTNRGDADLTDFAITPFASRPNFTSSTDCPATITPGQTCTITLGYGGSTTTTEAASFTVSASGQSTFVTIYAGPGRSVDAAFIRALQTYVAAPVVGPDDLAALEAGTTTRTAVADKVTSSDEWFSFLLQRFYRSAIGHKGDNDGVTYWTRQIRDGHRSVAQVAAQIFASNQAYQYAGGTDAAWLTRLYIVLLDRGIDPGGLSYWSGAIRAHGRAWVAQRLFDSPESRRQRVEVLYLGTLGRPPDPAGEAYWAGRILKAGDVILARYLFASDEFLRYSQYLAAQIP